MLPFRQLPRQLVGREVQNKAITFKPRNSFTILTLHRPLGNQTMVTICSGNVRSEFLPVCQQETLSAGPPPSIRPTSHLTESCRSEVWSPIGGWSPLSSEKEQRMIHPHSNGSRCSEDAGDFSQNPVQGEKEEQHARTDWRQMQSGCCL